MPIHTLRDYEAQDNPQSRPMPVPNQWQGGNTSSENTEQPQYGFGQQFMNYGQTDERQDDQFWSWNLGEQQPKWYHILLLCCCPCFVGNPCSPIRRQDYKRMLLTFIFWITILDIIYFIVEVSLGGVVSREVNPALGPGDATLIKLGAKQAYLIKNKYEIHRLLVPIIMHAGFMHLFMNLFVQFMIGLGYERNWKFYRIIPIYVISGIAGNLLSCCALPNNLSVGASGAILGLIGAKLANIICRWYKIPPQHRIVQVISAVITVAIVMLWSFSEYIDWASHLGGLIMGFFLGLAMFANSIENKVIRLLFIIVPSVLAFIFLLITSLMLGLVVKPLAIDY
ncbi:rhomboid-like protease [Acrasis kona]|uniref:rhomboid protease n=1 Tax=Acrasis kona TaxID=1008807 RepID=A0AAW2Z4F8_9EUKA